MFYFYINHLITKRRCYICNLSLPYTIFPLSCIVPRLGRGLKHRLKLVRTNLKSRELGTSTAAIFLSNDRSLYAPITSDECHA